MCILGRVQTALTLTMKLEVDKGNWCEKLNSASSALPQVVSGLSNSTDCAAAAHSLDHTLPQPIPELVLVHGWVPFLLVQVGRDKVVNFLPQVLIGWLKKKPTK